MRQNRYTRDIAEAQIDNSRGAFLPNVTSGYGFSQSVTGPREGSIIDPSTGELITTIGESRTSSSQSVNGSLNMTVFNLADFARLSASKSGAKAARHTYSDVRRQIAFQAKERYLNLLKAMKLLEVQQEQIRVSEESYRRSETLYEIGSAPLSDVLGTRATLERARVELINRENAVRVNISNLAFTLGLSPDAEIVPAEEPLELQPAPMTYEKAVANGMERNPGLRSQKHAIERSRHSLRATQSSVRYPTVSMRAGYSWTLSRDDDFGGLEDLFLKNYGYNFGLSVNFPVFNRLSTENTVKIQKLQYLQSQERLKQEERRLGLQIKQIYLNLERLRRSVAANEAAVEAAEEDYDLQTERYNLGASTFLERQQSQVSLFTARSQRIQAIYDYQIELARLDQLAGGSASENDMEEED